MRLRSLPHGPGQRGLRLLAILAALATSAFGLGATPALAGCNPDHTEEPRTLILALDGVPFRVIEFARARGAFEDWPPPSRLVSTFPSLTNVAFTAMFQPFGVGPAEGYEVQHFDVAENAVVGGTPFGYKDRAFGWRNAFDVTGRTVGSKLSAYTSPKKKWRSEQEEIEKTVLEARSDFVMAHMGSTDALQHLTGDKAAVDLILKLDKWLEKLRRRHEAVRGRPLHIVLLSDHGNSHFKIVGTRGFHRLLRDADLRIVERLESPRDVVAATFGLVGYGALFLHDDRAETAARAVSTHPKVELVTWRSGPSELRVISREDEATVRWTGSGDGLRIAYEASSGDPLRLARARLALGEAGRFDEQGFAADADWFRHSASAEYPDPLRRLIDAFTADHVVNTATVLFSLQPGYCWGWQTAQVSSWLRGGRLEGTHGGLDRDSSLGFFMSDDPGQGHGSAVRADAALTGYRQAWREAALCRAESSIASAHDPSHQASAAEGSAP